MNLGLLFCGLLKQCNLYRQFGRDKGRTYVGTDLDLSRVTLSVPKNIFFGQGKRQQTTTKICKGLTINLTRVQQV